MVVFHHFVHVFPLSLCKLWDFKRFLMSNNNRIVTAKTSKEIFDLILEDTDLIKQKKITLLFLVYDKIMWTKIKKKNKSIHNILIKIFNSMICFPINSSLSCILYGLVQCIFKGSFGTDNLPCDMHNYFPYFGRPKQSHISHTYREKNQSFLSLISLSSFVFFLVFFFSLSFHLSISYTNWERGIIITKKEERKTFIILI